MAIRKQLSHDNKTRERIKTSQLINRLQSNALGEIELTKDQIRSIEILLKKTLPDLQQVSHEGSIDQNVIVNGTLRWQRRK